MDYMKQLDDWQELILARYQNFPNGYTLCIGKEELSKADILEHIKAKDEIYEIIYKCEKEYFDALKDGSLVNFVKENR